MVAPLKPAITSDRQRYVDEPVYVEVSKVLPLAWWLNVALNTLALPQSLRGPLAPPMYALPRRKPAGPPMFRYIREFSHYERSRIRWMKPDGRGGVTPRQQQ